MEGAGQGHGRRPAEREVSIMMRAIPVRIDDRTARFAESQEFDPVFGAGVLFWMTLVGLAVLAAAL